MLFNVQLLVEVHGKKWIYLWIADLIYIFVNASDILDEIEPL